MTDEELLALVVAPFKDVPRPAHVNNCNCLECAELDERLAKRDRATLEACDLDYSVVLLSPDAFRYFMPGLVRLSLRLCLADKWGFCDHLVCFTLGQPVSKKKPPNHHPKAPDFTRDQTAAVLAFLEHIDGIWYNPGEERPKELRRAIRNWRHFVAAFDHDPNAARTPNSLSD